MGAGRIPAAMSDEILLRSDSGVTLIGGGPVDGAAVSRAIRVAPDLVAADGGADAAFDLGHEPLAAIGDMDSISPESRARLGDSRLFEIPEQDSVDFDKCVRSVSAPLIVAVGFLGGRADHQLAVFNALARRPGKRVVLLGADELAFLSPLEIGLSLPGAGTLVSVFPMRRVTAWSEGLFWELGGLVMEPGGRIGTSNKSLSGFARLRFDSPGALVFLPAGCFEGVVESLLAL